jgi:hypothetical protein
MNDTVVGKFNGTDKQFLQWIYDRLVHVHDEIEVYDYMQRFQAIINNTPDGLKTRW